MSRNYHQYLSSLNIGFITTSEEHILINNNAQYVDFKATLHSRWLHTTLMRKTIISFVWLLSFKQVPWSYVNGTAIPFCLVAWSHKLHKCFVKMKSFMRLAPLVVKNHYSCRQANGPSLKQRKWNIAQVPQSETQCFWWFEMSCVRGNEERMQLSFCPWWKSLFQSHATSTRLINLELGQEPVFSAMPVLIQTLSEWEE